MATFDLNKEITGEELASWLRQVGKPSWIVSTKSNMTSVVVKEGKIRCVIKLKTANGKTTLHGPEGNFTVWFWIVLILGVMYLENSAASYFGYIVVWPGTIAIGILVGASKIFSNPLTQAISAQLDDIARTQRKGISVSPERSNLPSKVDTRGQAVADSLRQAGYNVVYADEKWVVTDSDGSISQYFYSSDDMAAQAEFLLNRAKS